MRDLISYDAYVELRHEIDAADIAPPLIFFAAAPACRVSSCRAMPRCQLVTRRFISMRAACLRYADTLMPALFAATRFSLRASSDYATMIFIAASPAFVTPRRFASR